MSHRFRILLLCLCAFVLPAYAQAPPAAEQEEVPADAGPDPAELEALRDADRALQERLSARLAVIPGLEKARVEVSGGVATLRGQAADDGRRQLAATIVGQAEGVVLVENHLGIDTDVRVRTQPVFEQTLDKLRQTLAALPLLLVAAAIVVFAWWLGRWLSRRPRLLRRADRNPFLASLTRQAIRLAVLLAGVVVALDLLNATALVGALLGTAGIVGIAVGFAFRDVVENYLAGILLSLRQPFAPNDHVVIDGHEGKVAALTSRATILITLDGNHLRLPNALVFKGVMLNYSRNPTRSFAFEIRIANQASVSRAQAVALERLASIEGVLREPAPNVLVANLGDTFVLLRVTAWIDQHSTSFERARSETIRLVRRALAEAGVDMPGYPPKPEQAADLRGTTAPAAPRVDAERAAQADVAAERHIDRQIDLERAGMTSNNLLDPNAPRE